MIKLGFKNGVQIAISIDEREIDGVVWRDAPEGFDQALHVCKLENNVVVQYNKADLPADSTDAIKSAIAKAMGFGASLILDYGVKNVQRGYTAEQIGETSLVLRDVQAMLQAGALKSARSLIADLPENALIPQEDKDEFIAKITEYLGD